MDDYRSWDDAIPDWGSCLFLGHKGEGKSGLAWWLADGRHRKNPARAVIAWGIPRMAQGALHDAERLERSCNDGKVKGGDPKKRSCERLATVAGPSVPLW